MAPTDAALLDPGTVAAQHHHLLADAARRGRDDARRHMEDLLDRPLPFIEEAGMVTRTRIGHVGAGRAAELARVDQQGARRERERERLRTELAAAEAALCEHGVTAQTVAL